ncbi:AMP-binding protein [Streptococcus ruminicola]|uniref:AMP-binding protein n=1 Tax=Streptococcus ruminicola TaxID=2686210 RepID=UPI003982378B
MNFYDFIFKDFCLENVAIITKNERITYYDLLAQINKKCEIISDTYEVVILPVQNSKNMIVNLFASLKKNKKVIILNSNIEVASIELKGRGLVLKDDFVTTYESENEEFTKTINEISDINIMTSGTTGKPKLCPLSTHSIEERVNMLYEGYLKNRDKVIEGLVFPIFSITALTIQVFPTLLKGGTLVLIEKIEEIPHYLSKFNLDFLGLTPTIFKLICSKNIEIFNNLGNLFLGGEKIDFPIIKKISAKLTTNVFIGYGFTEGGGMISFGNIFEIPENSVGMILPSVEVRIKENKRLGELEIRNVGERDWVSSGDIAYIKDNYLYIVDRKKSIIISSGKNLFPSCIKDKVLTIEGVDDLIVYGIPDFVTGEAPAMDVVTKMEYDTFIAELKGVLSREEFPRKINFVSSLKINNSGKCEVKKI